MKTLLVALAERSRGTASDIDVQAREILRMNAHLQELIAADTGKSVERATPTYWGRVAATSPLSLGVR